MSPVTTVLESPAEVFVKEDSQILPSNLEKDPFWYLSLYTQDCDGDTQLHICVINSPEYKNFTKRLIQATWPASLLDIRNNVGMTALHLGAMEKNAETVRQLLVAGANPLIKDNYGWTALHYACKNGTIDVVNALTKGFDIQETMRMKSRKLRIPDLSRSLHERNNKGEAPIHLATEFGYLDIVQRLLDLGAKLDVMRYQDGRRPLHIAIMKGHKHITKLILKFYEKNPDDQLQDVYCYPELMKPLQQMGLDGAFIRIFDIPVYRLFPHLWSDSDRQRPR